MELEELKKELKELKKEFNELAKIINKEVTSTRWRASYAGIYYYYVCSDGNINWNCDFNGDVSTNRYNLGNYFQTKEQTEKVVEKIKIYTQLKDLALRLNHGREIDWRNYNQLKYSIYYDSFYKNIYTICTYYSKELGQIYCLDENFLNIAIKEIGEENLEKLFE